MESIKLQTHVGQDGILNLRIPVGVRQTDVEVVVVLQKVLPEAAGREAPAREWPPGFFEQTFGSFRDEPLERGEQGEYETRGE